MDGNMPTNKGLKPDIARLLPDALENGWGNYHLELMRCRQEASIDAIHDLRVATRRMLAIIQLLNSISPRPRMRRMIRLFKDQLDQLDQVRDTQVVLAEVVKISEELPQLKEFQTHLQSIEGKLLRDLPKKIDKFETSRIARQLLRIRESIDEQKNENVELQVMQAVDDAYLLTRQRLGLVDLAHPGTIHRVRIAFKSFRYMLEIIHPVVRGFPAGYLKRMNHYQSLMGEIQDAEVFIQTFGDFSKHASVPEPEPVRRYYGRRHAQAISAFVEEIHQLDTFWCPAPDQPFPWEKPR